MKGNAMDLKTLQMLMYRATGMIVLGHRLVYAPAKGRGHSCYINDGALAAFGDAAIAREREACAQLCESIAADHDGSSSGKTLAEVCAEAIRSRALD